MTFISINFTTTIIARLIYFIKKVLMDSLNALVRYLQTL